MNCMFMFEYRILPSAEGPTLEISPRVGALASTTGVKEYGKLLSELCPRRVIIKGDSPAYVPNPDFVTGASGTKKRFGADIRTTVLSMYCSQRVFSDVTACAIFDVTWSNLASSTSFMEALTAMAMWPVMKEPDATSLNLAKSVAALKDATTTVQRSYEMDTGRDAAEGGDARQSRGEDCIPDREFYTLVKSYALNEMELADARPPTPRSVLYTLDNSLCLAESLMRKQGLLPDTEYPGPSAAARIAESVPPRLQTMPL